MAVTTDEAHSGLVEGRTRTGALLALPLCVFALCSSEYVLVGLLGDISQSLKVSVPSAGWLLSAYALAAAIGGPAVSALTARVPLKRLIVVLMLVFALANVFVAAAGSFGMMVAARTVAALTHSTFAAACIVSAVRMSPPHRAASAVSWVTAGFTAATVFGGPLGTLIGQQWGWRSAFWAVAGVNVVGATVLVALLPAGGGQQRPQSVRSEVTVLGRGPVLLALTVTTLSQIAWFTPYAYIGPSLADTTGLAPTMVTLLLFVFGVGSLVGNLAGGPLADRSVRGTVLVLLVLLGVVLLLFGAMLASKPLAATAVFGLGLASGALIPALNTWVLGAAGGSSVLALSANTSAFNLGNGLGSVIGGQALAAGYPQRSLGWIGAVVLVMPLVATVWMVVSARRRGDAL
ncbi:MFS transporter [Streptomyces angustmyceticus]|uniref:MFS transporter n=1 Tax=Streptomyces angustmyceticus TaxID=285578 RepID=A0A5J4LM57_9ACTN|nr:MFS transporter [Streptomyces angustmyceticus]UAL70997.1 MFS transporter [Streptomyces angustmyceticus]GES32579.1 MFS transporter [Streptomyces angustmyceticus]